jgi:hypothetical protein
MIKQPDIIKELNYNNNFRSVLYLINIISIFFFYVDIF